MIKPNKRPKTLRRWLQSTSRRTFVLYPVVIILLELIIHKGQVTPVLWGIPLLPWGYLQYRLCGEYRTRHGGGGPGVDIPPERIVDTGIYAWTRNPMYLGHIIFMAGLAITFTSFPAIVLLTFHFFWFNNRAKADEEHLAKLFGSQYINYRNKVKRWIPGIL